MNHPAQESPMHSSPALLEQAEKRWRAWFARFTVPVLAGLAPLADDEHSILLGAIHHSVRGNAFRLSRLIELYPAAMVVCLSRVAMECYDGNFWGNFGDRLQAEFPAPVRPQLANAFRRARRSVTSVFVPACFGSMPHAGEFLFKQHCRCIIARYSLKRCVEP